MHKMQILSFYIIKRFLSILFYASFAFIAIFIIVDLIERLDDFLAQDAGWIQLVYYYIYYIPFIIILTLPINTLLSTLFSIGIMAQNNEIIACKAAGISLYRITFPLLILGLVISVLSGVASETVVPHTNKLRLDIWRYEIRKEQKNLLNKRNRLALQDGKNRQIYIGFYDSARRKGTQINVVWMNQNGIAKRLDAKSMVWREDRSAWLFTDVVERTFTDSSEKVSYLDTLWYNETKIYPDDLVELETKPEEMNYGELNRFVDRMTNIGADARKWLVDLYMKISYPFANFIIVLFGAPLASRKRRSGPAIGFAIALMVSFIYFLFLRTGQVLGHKGDLNPWIAAWIGNFVFGIGGIIAMLKVRK
jgi:lipopolysaccharide export system permease protein